MSEHSPLTATPSENCSEYPASRKTPWRLDPETRELQVGDVAIVGIPPTTVRIMHTRRHDPPLELGWLPRPEVTLGVCFQGDEDEDEAGFALYQPNREPIVIERADGAQSLGG